MDNLEKAFRQLRLAWFNYHMKHKPHEREWEDEEDEKLRESYNKVLFDHYNEQTEDIIKGIDRPISPRCGWDLEQ